MRKPN
jgi:hypothetical protein